MGGLLWDCLWNNKLQSFSHFLTIRYSCPCGLMDKAYDIGSKIPGLSTVRVVVLRVLSKPVISHRWSGQVVIAVVLNSTEGTLLEW